jgi:hypothetical protein
MFTREQIEQTITEAESGIAACKAQDEAMRKELEAKGLPPDEAFECQSCKSDQVFIAIIRQLLNAGE